MVTQGTNEGSSETNRTGSGLKNNHNGYSHKGSNQGGQTSHESRGRRPMGDSRDKESPRGDSYNRGRTTSKSKSAGYHSRPYDKGRSFGVNPRFAGKDDDDEDNVRRSRPSRPKESKSGTAIPDKNKAMMRLEKEQKSMQKKKNKKKESSRPQPKLKRSNNINYTKNYANGDYDDYEDYYE